ncbi:MAG: hypothetical protein ACE1ZS_08560 [Candidatus Poribacteria bacterium]
MFAKIRDWLVGGGLLALSLYLCSLYAKGQWEHTIRFLKEWLQR